MSKLKINLIVIFLLMKLFVVRTIITMPLNNTNNTNTSSVKLISSIEYWLNKYYLSVKTVVETECKNYLVKLDGKNWQCNFLLLNDQDPNDSSSFHCLCKHYYECEDREEFFLNLPSDYYNNYNMIEENDKLLVEFDENSMRDVRATVNINELCQESINKLTVETTWSCDHVNKTRDSDYYYNEYEAEVNTKKNMNEEIYCECNRSKLCQFDKIINFNSI